MTVDPTVLTSSLAPGLRRSREEIPFGSVDRNGHLVDRLCHSRSRMRAASVSPADAEVPTALIAYAATLRWVGTRR